MKHNKNHGTEPEAEHISPEAAADNTPETTATAAEAVAEAAATAETAAPELDELETLKAENKKLKEDFLRAYADAENTKRRCTQEIEKNNKYAVSSFAKNLLSVADNLDRALKSIPEDKKNDCEHLKSLLSGVEMTQRELDKVFEKFGIKINFGCRGSFNNISCSFTKTKFYGNLPFRYSFVNQSGFKYWQKFFCYLFTYK